MNNVRGPFLLAEDSHAPFPPATLALSHPDGLLAVGGDLSMPRLLNAYAGGIFPWFSPGQPLLWWSPDPRMVFFTNQIHLSRRFCRSLRSNTWIIRADTCFTDVIKHCAQIKRESQRGTWITPEMQAAYSELHQLGIAHSIEVFSAEQLVGGLYGVALGQMFFAESMFSAESGGSKVALAALTQQLAAWQWPLIDAQVENPHLRRLGAVSLPRAEFLPCIQQLVRQTHLPGTWTQRFGTLKAADLVKKARPACVFANVG